ncbi:MAG: hypothetical protein R2813_08725 [Flavobacteriales bacterium]
MEQDKMNEYFGSVGIRFPRDERELANFNQVSKDFNFQGNEHVIDPQEILRSIQPVTNIDYHKRTVLAAEIVFQLQNEKTIGHLKLQKLIYLCQQTANMTLHTNFLKQAMGPYDPIMMRSIDKKLRENGWFEYIQGSFPPYKPLDKAGAHKTWFERYFENQEPQINTLLDIFRKATSDQVELVATIYACWLEAKKRKQIVSENLMIERVYAWSAYKEKFTKIQIKSAYHWMEQKGIRPAHI